MLQGRSWGIEGLGLRLQRAYLKTGSLDLGGSLPTPLPFPVMSVTHHLAPRHRPSCCWPFLAQPWMTSLPPKPSRTRGRGGNLAGPLGRGAGGWFQATSHLPYSRHTQERGQELAGPHPHGVACEEGPRAQGSEDVPRTVPSPTVGGAEGFVSTAAPPTPRLGCVQPGPREDTKGPPNRPVTLLCFKP